MSDNTQDIIETDPETPADARVPINIHPYTRKRLRDFLMRPDVPRGMGYTAFIEWALNKAAIQLDDCTDDGSGECQTHIGGYRPDETSPCDLGGL